MKLKYSEGKPVVKITKTVVFCVAADELLALTLVEPDAKRTVDYLTGLVGRFNADGVLAPVLTGRLVKNA